MTKNAILQNSEAPQFDRITHMKYPDTLAVLSAIYAVRNRSKYEFYDGIHSPVVYSQLSSNSRKILERLGYDIIPKPCDQLRLITMIDDIRVHIHRDLELSAVIVGIRSSGRANCEAEIKKIQDYFYTRAGVTGEVQKKRRVGKC